MNVEVGSERLVHLIKPFLLLLLYELSILRVRWLELLPFRRSRYHSRLGLVGYLLICHQLSCEYGGGVELRLGVAFVNLLTVYHEPTRRLLVSFGVILSQLRLTLSFLGHS